MTQIYRQPIDHKQAWKRKDIAGKESLMRWLGKAELDALDSLMPKLRAMPVESITKDDMSHPALVAFMKATLEQVTDGSGAAIINGWDRDKYSDMDFERICWGLCMMMGTAISQSPLGDRIGHVRVEGNNPNARGYRSSRELLPHTDTPDMLILMSLRKAKSGGETRLVNALAIHNDMLANHPEHMEPLYKGFPYHRQGQQLPGQTPVTPYAVPVFCNVGGTVSCRYARFFMPQAAETLGVPFPEDLRRAMTYMNERTDDPEFCLDFMLEPGDMMIVNNYTLMHARTEFVDYEDPALRRHLLRLWINPEPVRPAAIEMDWYQQPGGLGRGGCAKQEAWDPKAPKLNMNKRIDPLAV